MSLTGASKCPQCSRSFAGPRRYCSDPCYWEFRAGEAPGSPRSVRQEAAERGLYWPDVQAAFEELRGAAAEKRAYLASVYRTGWQLAAGLDGTASAAQRRFRQLTAERDCTAIPRYDEIAQEIGWWFPEYATGDGCEQVWEFLLGPPPARLDWRRLYREAMDEVERLLNWEAAVGDPSAQFGPTDWDF